MRDLLTLTGHTLHAVVVLGGLAGMAALLAPGLAQRAGLLRAPDGPVDRRVAELRERVAAGTLAASRSPTGRADHPAPVAPRRGDAPLRGDGLLAAAVVAGVAAAGVHAAVGPMHLSAYPVLGVGFLVVAVLQAAWALALLTATAPVARLASLGALLHGGALTAWAVSRTVGLPLGLHGDGPQPVGPWDLAAVAWQVLALWWCLGVLAGRRTAAHPRWGAPAVRTLLGTSALVLVVLTLSGASA